jgi:hypothetical protein
MFGDAVSLYFPYSSASSLTLSHSLAYAELYYVISAMFRHFELELFETTRKDIDPKFNWFIPKPETNNGVQLIVTK